jgi:hypothetical protein
MDSKLLELQVLVSAENDIGKLLELKSAILKFPDSALRTTCLSRARDRIRYKTHREQRCAASRERGSRPEVKAQRKLRESSPDFLVAQRIKDRERYAEDPSSKKAGSAKYRAQHPDKARSAVRAWQETHRGRTRELAMTWYRKNTKRASANKNAWSKKRSKIDPSYRLGRLLRCRVSGALKHAGAKKAASTLKLVGCIIEQLRGHLESRWLPGMTWENHSLHGWHSDHKKPCAKFDLSDPEQQRQCFHFTNLQPMWAGANMKKWAHFPK